jgi:hypothetical protein
MEEVVMQSKYGISNRWRLKTALCTSALALSAFGYAATGDRSGPAQDGGAADAAATESPISPSPSKSALPTQNSEEPDFIHILLKSLTKLN